MKNKKKKGAYGKRYSQDHKQTVAANWRKNLASAAPISKSAFGASNSITTITLNKWIAEFPEAKARSTNRQPETKAEAVTELQSVVVVESEVVSVIEAGQALTIVPEDDTVRIVHAIRTKQAEIAQLKSQLLDIVGAL